MGWSSQVPVPSSLSTVLTVFEFRQPQEPAAIDPRFIRRFYPPEVDSGFCGANRDYHTAYYGEILAAYILE